MGHISDTQKGGAVQMLVERTDLRNIAIVAHVIMAKRRLSTPAQAGARLSQQPAGGERILDSNDLERERGITILAKKHRHQHLDEETDSRSRSISWTTPGMRFRREVERVLNMVDGVLLLVDAAEGPCPKHALCSKKPWSLAIAHLVINKVDRKNADLDGLSTRP